MVVMACPIRLFFFKKERKTTKVDLGMWDVVINETAIGCIGCYAGKTTLLFKNTHTQKK